MTKIETAAKELYDFIREGCAPEEAIGKRDAEWPLAITADNEEDAGRLADLLQKLGQELSLPPSDRPLIELLESAIADLEKLAPFTGGASSALAATYREELQKHCPQPVI